tara:strand:- start:214 stop:588 length:375 start_codon:yes stop_codon:yes gene_type:complete
VDIAPGELVDKITILEIKLERITGEAKLQNIRTEWAVLTKARDADLPRSTQLDNLTAELKEINEKLWVIEDDIRDCERQRDFSNEFIRLARAVYLNNDERARLKRRINELLGSPLIEEKSYAAY